MTMQVETAGWSGEGEFTQLLIDRLRSVDAIAYLRVEDAPASRSDADYNFISNEIYVAFAAAPRSRTRRWFGLLPRRAEASEARMTVSALESMLGGMPDVGLPDYSDSGMLQYLRTERIVPPYQTRGYKLVELVRIYELGAI
jgi:hypothetical protein